MRNVQAQSTKTESFEKRLRAYAAGAGAAAAGLLAFSPPALAEIVVVPAHVTLGTGTVFPISVEGRTEFTLVNQLTTDIGGYGGVTDSLVVSAASVAGVGRRFGGQVAPFNFGAVIGPAERFEGGQRILAEGWGFRYKYGTYGPFANTVQRFLGLKFELDGKRYYGWAGFSKVEIIRGIVTATLTAYAYETEPNTPIYAGQSSDSPRESRLLPANGSALNAAKLQPATLGVLALGHPGLNVWRKREAAETGASEA